MISLMEYKNKANNPRHREETNGYRGGGGQSGTTTQNHNISQSVQHKEDSDSVNILTMLIGSDRTRGGIY